MLPTLSDKSMVLVLAVEAMLLLVDTAAVSNNLRIVRYAHILSIICACATPFCVTDVRMRRSYVPDADVA